MVLRNVDEIQPRLFEAVGGEMSRVHAPAPVT